MSRDRRLSRRLQLLFVDDPYRKLVAIGLAVLLWFFVDSRITAKLEPRTLYLSAVTSYAEATEFDQLSLVLPDDIAVLRYLDGETEIDTVEVTLSGPRFRVEPMAGQPLSLMTRSPPSREAREPVPEGQPPVVEDFVFTVADILRNTRELQGVKIEMEPERVRVVYERLTRLVIERPEHVTDYTAPDIEKDRLLWKESVVMTPPTVAIRGRAAAIATLKNRTNSIFRVSLHPMGGQDRVSGQLELIDESLGLSFDSPAPQVQVDLVPRRDPYALTLPVQVDDQSLPAAQRGLYQPVEPSLEVEVSFSGSLAGAIKVLGDDQSRQEWAAENLRIVVYLARLQPGEQLVEEFAPRAYLTLAGPKQHLYASSEYLWEDPRPVNLRRSK